MSLFKENRSYPKSLSYSSIVCYVFRQGPLPTNLRNKHPQSKHINLQKGNSGNYPRTFMTGFFFKYAYLCWDHFLFSHLGLPPPSGNRCTGQSYTGSSRWRPLRTSCSTTGRGCRCCHICDLLMRGITNRKKKWSKLLCFCGCIIWGCYWRSPFTVIVKAVR